MKPDFAAANGLLAFYLAANNQKLPEALTLGQKAVTLEPENSSYQLTVVQVLLRMRRYDDAENLVHRVHAAAMDDNIRTQADQMLTYITQARDFDARQRQMQEDAAAREKAFAAQRQQAAARSEQTARKSEETTTAEITSVQNGDPDPMRRFKRRTPATDVIAVVVQVRCNGNEMEVTAKVADRQAPMMFRANDRTRIGYTSNTSAIHDDIDPCSELRGHTAKLIFTPSAVKWVDGELVHIEVEK